MSKLSVPLEQAEAVLGATFLGNSVEVWLYALGVFLLSYLVLRIGMRLAVRYVGKIAAKTSNQWDDIVVDMLRQTRFWFILALSLFLASIALDIPDRQHALIRSLTSVVVLVQAGLWVNTFITLRLQQYRHKQLDTNPAGVTTLNALGFVGKILLWSTVLLLALDNFGINVTALIAGLGVGGIAVALAVQNILGDLFASLSIILDKPFAVGDFLIIDEHLGSVENVGLKTTRLRSLSGEQLVFSNSDLLKSRIRNFGRMYQRRVVFNIGVTYQTPRDRIRMIPDILRNAIEVQPDTRFDRSHFKDYGPYSLNFETVYYVLAADYNKYMDIQQAINLDIHEAFEQQGIEFAYPTQTLLIQGGGNPVAEGFSTS